MATNEDLAGILSCVDAIVSQYNEAQEIIQQVKALRADKQAPAPSRYLEESLQCSPQDITREKERGLGRFGLTFQQGDHDALSSLREVNSKLQLNLLQQLRELAHSEDLADFRHLVDEADSGRDQAVDTLIQLRQRCLAAESELENRKSSEASIPAISPLQEVPRQHLEPAKTYHFPQQHNPWLRLHHRSHSAAKFDSREASGEEDAHSGAETSHKKHGHHGGSLLHFLKHHRGHSHEKAVDHSADEKRLPRAATLSSHESVLARSNGSVVSLGGPQDAPAQQPWWSSDSDRKSDPPSLHRQSSEMSHRDSAASVDTIVGISPTSQGLRSRTASNATSVFRNSSLAVPTPTPDNDYLGFCKAAVRLQNGDKKALEKRREFNDGWSQSTVYYLACSSHKCAFAGHIDISQIMTRVFEVESKGLKFRWPFLAKSHIAQQKFKDNVYSYQCLFCVYSGEKSTVYLGTDAYLDHVSTHRGELGAVTLYKARCINDHIASNSEDFDINLFPLSTEEARERRASELLSEDLMALHMSPYGTGKNDSVIEDSNEPWNAGLSDFHYRDEFERGAMG